MQYVTFRLVKGYFRELKDNLLERQLKVDKKTHFAACHFSAFLPVFKHYLRIRRAATLNEPINGRQM